MPEVIPGFSLVNRWLLYTSVMLTPAQAIAGIGSNCPTNIGFLVYNWYSQYAWYSAARNKELHALSLLPVHLNIIYAFTYLGGITSGNIVMGVLLGLGTAGLLVLNTTSAWISWATNLPEGYGQYQFFFFGWRTLTPSWRKFILVWQIADTSLALGSIMFALGVAIVLPVQERDIRLPRELNRYFAIFWGSAVALLFTWPLILWAELIVSRNHIESQTDMIAVWLFVAQVGTLVMPDIEFGHAWNSLKDKISFSSKGSATSSNTLPLGNLSQT